jgi:hypothetical protein
VEGGSASPVLSGAVEERRGEARQDKDTASRSGIAFAPAHFAGVSTGRVRPRTARPRAVGLYRASGATEPPAGKRPCASRPLRGDDPSRAPRRAQRAIINGASGSLASVSALIPVLRLARRGLSVRRTYLAPCPLVSIVRAIEVLMQAKRHSPPKLVRRCGRRRLGGKPAKAGSSTIVPARLRRVPQAPPAALRARRRGNWPPPDQHKDQSHGYHRISHEA